MTIAVEQMLDDTYNRLRKLGEAIKNLVKSYQDVFNVLEIASCDCLYPRLLKVLTVRDITNLMFTSAGDLAAASAI